jgi:hypothetical protein
MHITQWVKSNKHNTGQGVLLTGEVIQTNNIHTNEIDIEHIANALGNICRYGGQVKQFYSVAEHCVMMTRLGAYNDQFKLKILLHDAAEAYLGDVVTGLKQYLPEYRVIERILQAKIHAKFDCLPSDIETARIKSLDQLAFRIEVADLYSNRPYMRELEYWNPREASKIFLETFDNVCPDQL